MRSKLNRHWSHSPGHVDIQNPRPPRHLFEVSVSQQPIEQTEQLATNQNDEENDVDEERSDSDNDLRFLQNDLSMLPPTLPSEDELDIGEPDSQIQENIQQFPGAGNECPSMFTLLTQGQPNMNGHHYIHPHQRERDTLKQRRQENIYFPFENSAQFYLAEAFARPDIQSKDRIVRTCVLGRDRFLRDGAAFSSYNDFITCLDIIRNTQAPWVQREIKWKPGSTTWRGHIKYWQRDSLAVLQEMLENPALKDFCVWAPVQETSEDGERIYTDIHTSEWWWNIQVYSTFP